MNFALSEALKEAYAIAPSGKSVLETLELRLAGQASVFIYRGIEPLDMRLETGEWATFEPVPFQFKLPKSSEQNMGDGSYNVAVGAEAMQYGSAGVGNTVVGANAMTANNGNYNAVFGRYALNSAGNSTSNSVFGCNAVSNLQSGSSNTILGYQAGSAAEVLNNVTLIGANAQPSNSIVDNEVTIGDENVTALRAAVTSITSLSDARDKKDIAALPWGLDFVKTLKPVKFTWNTRSGKKVDVKDSGFIAQDLLASETDADAKEHLKLVLDTNPEKLEASAGRLMPVLVKAIQELAAQVEDLKAQLEAKNAE